MGPAPAKRKKKVADLKVWIFPVLLSYSLLNSTTVRGSVRQFVPRYVDFSGNLQVNSLYEKDWYKAAHSVTRSDLTVIESFHVDGIGYIYSPLFISMKTSVGLGLRQERVENISEKYSSYGDANTFRQEFKVLPSHPYNLDLYFARRTPLTGGRAGESGSVVIYEYGAQARYVRRPWSTTMTYTNYEANSPSNPTRDNFIYNLNYFKSGVNAAGVYTHSETAQDNGFNETKRDFYNLSFTKDFEKVRFTSWWNEDKQEQSDTSGSLNLSDTDRQEFYGSFDVTLPANFNSFLSYRTSDSDSFYRLNNRDTKTFSDTETYEFRLRHRLFSSLNTSFSYANHNIDSISGESEKDSYRLRGDYTKKMRWGRIISGLWGDLSFFDNQGAPRTLFEQPRIDAGDRLTLNFRTIDPGTIRAYVVDHNDGNRLVPLVENVDYTIIPGSDPVQLRIINWPPTNGLADPVGLNPQDGYTYQVDYALLPADYVLRTTSWGGSLRLPIVDDLISPHYSYSQTKQKELEGDFPGDPAESKTHVAGLAFNREPINGDVTQLWLRSNTISEDRFNAFINYRREFTPFTSGILSLSYENSTTKQKDQFNAGRNAELDESIYTAQAQIQSALPQKNLNTTFTTNYSLYKGIGDTKNLSFLTNLNWKVGKLSMDFSASYSHARSVFGDTTSTRQHFLGRLMLKRELF